MMTQHNIMKNESKKILIVEDDVLIQIIHGSMLKDMGYSSDIAENGGKALSLFKENNYCAILLDIGLPDINGIEVAKAIRKFENKKYHTPIIVATAYLEADIKTETIAAGVDIMMSKPVLPEDLGKKLEKLIATYKNRSNEIK